METTLTATIPTAIYAEILKKREQFETEQLPRIFKKYGEISKADAQKIYEAESELQTCKKCVGLPCMSKAKGFQPVIEVEEKFGATVRYRPCTFTMQKRKKARMAESFKAAKIPAQYVGKTFADYKVTADNSAAIKAAKEFLRTGTGGLFLFGNPGTGKTFLTSIIAQECLKNDKTVIFGDVPTLLEILRGSFDDKNTKITDLMDNLTEVDLLVLDDLGTENPTEWAVERIYSIINQRYNAQKPLIVTSNFTLGDLARRLNNPKNASGNQNITGNRIVSRLAQMCERLELTGGDWRL